MRLIDADDLEISFDKECDGDCEICENALRNNGFYSCKLIADAPTVEAEEVVRCKDCRYRDPEDKKCDCGKMERVGNSFAVHDDYFCAYGERQEAEE